jgi:hypothetical protein
MGIYAVLFLISLFICWQLFLFLNKIQRSVPKSDLAAIEYLDFNLNKLIADKDIPSEFKSKFLDHFEKEELPYVSVRTEYHLGGLIRERIEYSYANGKVESFEYDNYVSYLYGINYKNHILLAVPLGKKLKEEHSDFYALVVRRELGSLYVSIGCYSLLTRQDWLDEKVLYELDLSRESMEKYYKQNDLNSRYGYEVRNYTNGESMDNPWVNSVDCLNWRITTVDYYNKTFTK